jgi:hypothetical protein
VRGNGEGMKKGGGSGANNVLHGAMLASAGMAGKCLW